jgi:hypothetical protein
LVILKKKRILIRDWKYYKRSDIENGWKILKKKRILIIDWKY